MKTSVTKFKSSNAQRKFSLCICAFTALTTFCVSTVSTAYAQSNDVLNRVKRIENEIDTLNRAVYKGEKPPSISQDSIDAAARMEQRLSQIENDIRTLTGKFEQQAYDNQQLSQKLEALSQDSNLRLDALEKQSRQVVAPAQPMEDTNTIPPANIGASDDETIPKSLQLDAPQDQSAVTGQETGAMDAASLYEQGFGEIKANNYDAAEKSFSSFVKQYPTHALAPNALYWLGETYYVRKNYDKAARTFAESYQKYPDGPKGADNLLKLGMSLAAKGEKSNACIALGQLKKEYPTGPEPVLKRGAEQMEALGCT